MAGDERFWIRVPGDTDSPQVSRATRKWQQQGRRTPAVIGVMKAAPDTLKAVDRMNMATTFGGSVLGRRREELIAASVSALNACFY